MPAALVRVAARENTVPDHPRVGPADAWFFHWCRKHTVWPLSRVPLTDRGDEIKPGSIALFIPAVADDAESFVGMTASLQIDFSS